MSELANMGFSENSSLYCSAVKPVENENESLIFFDESWPLTTAKKPPKSTFLPQETKLAVPEALANDCF